MLPIETWIQILDHIPAQKDALSSVVTAMDDLSRIFAGDVQERAAFGEAELHWTFLQKAWMLLDIDDEGLRHFMLSLTRFTRNLVAQTPSNQLKAFQLEFHVCRIVRQLTSFSLITDQAVQPHLRMIIQLLSNMITSNEQLSNELWRRHTMPNEGDDLFLRILQSNDPLVTQTCFILLLNLLHDSPSNIQQLLDHGVGRRILLSLLDRLESQTETEDNTQRTQAFEIGYRLFEMIFEACDFDSLWNTLHYEDTIISPARITFLKLLDAHLQSKSSQNRYPSRITFLVAELRTLSYYAINSIQKSIGPDTKPLATSISSKDVEIPPQNLDPLLPRVSQALILICQCLTPLALAEESSLKATNTPTLTDLLKAERTPLKGGIPECLIALLRQLDRFLPRIMFGKPVKAGPSAKSHPDASGFAYLKRDLVNLLGVIVYEDKTIQDRIRECNGIPIIMNLCVIDERNPFLREHAVFTLRNALHKNIENQKIVDAIKPSGYWDENGVLRDLPSATRK